MGDHPVKVPQDLAARLWIESEEKRLIYGSTRIFAFANLIAQWAADQELEACIDVLGSQSAWDVLAECTGWKEFRDQSEDILRTARRPKPPTLAEQALKAAYVELMPEGKHGSLIISALNRLAELEVNQ